MIPQLPATTLPTVYAITNTEFEQLAKQNQSYEKHYPPMLGDEVWRLEKIGKDGLFHKNLASMGVNTVQDFLKMLIVHPGKLRRIFGVRMSEKMWNVTIKHAKTCVMGNKHYVFQGSDYRIMLNPICQLIKAEINGSIYPTHKQSDVDRAYLKDLVRQAYVNWSSLEEIEGISNEIGNLIQGDHVVDQYPDHSQIMVRSFQHNAYLIYTQPLTNFNLFGHLQQQEIVLPSLNQKSNPDNDQKAISEQDDNSAGSIVNLVYPRILVGLRRRLIGFIRVSGPWGPAKKSVERSLDWQTTEVIHRASHNHPKSQPTKTSSLSAFSRILRAFNHLTIKIPDKSFVTYEGGKMDDDGTLQKQPCSSYLPPLLVFREMVQSFTGMRNEAPEEIRTEIARKKAWYANLKEISGKDIHCISRM
ncbi:AP-3 complex subunit delta-like [Hibiscus syriacus]|uniref:AP-3 complex subunit delta-like n=1 Tax=Hibiscus syriacus TaxID=106335 RepID=A0A6A2YX03_HIBSY|nr:AP-3 complex subunit delta-like [Hibiscus syriacus]